MTNFNQITLEIDEQVASVSSTIADKNTQIADLQKELPALHTQLEGLQTLKTQTEELIAQANSNDIRFHHTFELQSIAQTQADGTTPPTSSFVNHGVSG